MSTPTPLNDDSRQEANKENSQSRFSLHRLSEAFARLTSTSSTGTAHRDVARGIDEVEQADAQPEPSRQVLSPRMIVEGMLFVGQPDGTPLTNRAMAAQIRDVSPREVDVLVAELNEIYEESGCCYRIASEGAGYQMKLRAEYEAVQHRLLGRDKQVRLSRQALEVLSVVAYRQPLSAEEVSDSRGSRSNSLLAQLVRRGLLRLERKGAAHPTPLYHTTQRFNHLLNIRSPEELPQSEDLDDG